MSNGSALLVIKRGPNAGSRFALNQPVTSAGRHPNSDIFCDDITVSRRHAEFRCQNNQFQVVDVGSLNRPGVSGHFTSFESESERHVIIEAVKQLSARVA